MFLAAQLFPSRRYFFSAFFFVPPPNGRSLRPADHPRCNRCCLPLFSLYFFANSSSLISCLRWCWWYCLLRFTCVYPPLLQSFIPSLSSRRSDPRPQLYTLRSICFTPPNTRSQRPTIYGWYCDTNVGSQVTASAVSHEPASVRTSTQPWLDACGRGCMAALLSASPAATTVQPSCRSLSSPTSIPCARRYPRVPCSRLRPAGGPRGDGQI
jgi:hypothetical protein